MEVSIPNDECSKPTFSINTISFVVYSFVTWRMLVPRKLITLGLDRCSESDSRSTRYIFVTTGVSLVGCSIDECVQKCMINDGRVSMHFEMEEIERRRKNLGKGTNHMTGQNRRGSWPVAFN